MSNCSIWLSCSNSSTINYASWDRGAVYWLVEVEAACRGSDADMALLHSHNVQVHEVTVHLPVSRWRVPAAHGEDFQALHGLLEVLKQGKNSNNIYTVYAVCLTVFTNFGILLKDPRLRCSSPSSPCSVAGEAPGGALCCRAGCALGGCSQSAPAHCPFSSAYHYLQSHKK